MSTVHDPLTIRGLQLANRLVMSPMTRAHSPLGVPGTDVIEYYRRRAAGGTSLIITEGVAVNHPASVDHSAVPHMYGDHALEGWRAVVDAVHAEGGRIIPQLWHVGPLWGAMDGALGLAAPISPMRPSGLWGTPGLTTYPEELVAASIEPTRAMTEEDIAEVLAAYAEAATNAAEVGFDGIAIHGGHGYLLDSFMWKRTNQRDDRWGGSREKRAAFPAAVVSTVRSRMRDEMPLFYRFSQHKQQDYRARVAETPEELGTLLKPLVDAGVDVLDASARRFQAPAFEGSPLTLAGWAKKLTGAKSMAVGSFGLGKTLQDRGNPGAGKVVDNRNALEQLLAAGEFDLMAVGRLHLAAPALAEVLRSNAPLPEFDRNAHEFVLR